MSSEINPSEYAKLTDAQERMTMFDIYVMGTAGITLSVIMLYSYISSKKVLETFKNNRYYTAAINCGILLSISSMIVYILKLLSNDFIIPIDQFIVNNFNIVSMIDSCEIIVWSIAKLSFYYGFTFIYLSLAQKEKIDTYLRIVMVFIFIATFAYCTLYFVDDLLIQSSKEISVTEKRSIFVVSVTSHNVENSITVTITAMIAMISDFIFIAILLYKYISGIQHNNNSHAYAAKGIILLSISSIVFLLTMITVVLRSDIRYLIDNIQIITDTICLFLMFKSNHSVYNNLCGWLCDKYCVSFFFGTVYDPIQNNDIDDENDQAP
eukprot:207710_1